MEPGFRRSGGGWAGSVAKRGRRAEHLETFLLVLIALVLFSACVVVALGTVAAARTASSSIRLPVSEGHPSVDYGQG